MLMLNVNAKPDWQNINVLSKNRLPSRSYFIPYQSMEVCAGAAIESRFDINSDRFLLLSGMWEFSYFPSVAELPEDFLNIKGKLEYVPSTWQAQGYEKWHYSNVNYTIPVMPPMVPNHNPVGVYKRTFELPESFKNNIIKISFLGVSSSYHLYINKKEVGYSQVSHMTSEFDITPYIVSGANEIVVVVYKWCDGTYLEDQDFFRCNGIFRDVFLTAQPEINIEDFHFITTKKDNLSAFEVNVKVKMSRNTDDVKITLKDKNGIVVYEEIKATDKRNAEFNFNIENPLLWNAEQPNCYSLYVAHGKNSNFECIKHLVGFKEVVIKDSVFYINEQNIKIRGVNRHDSNPQKGYAVSFEDIKIDLMLMKKLNVNAIRTSHYPNDPLLYQLADFLGLYIVDETDLETHGLKDIKTGNHDWSYLTKHTEWKAAFLDRVERMVQRDKNHPSIIIWSMGNESGIGENHYAMADYVRRTIPGAIVHYCEFMNLPEQLFSRMYTDPVSLEEYGKNKDNDPRPFYLCEYAHSMGIGPGSFKEYWDIIYKYPRLMGGCVWEWCDHAVMHKDADGKVTYTYGGDSGEFPHDGNFCVDGLVLPDRTPSTAAWEMKQAYSPLRIELINGKLHISNKWDFINISLFSVSWALIKNGKVIKSDEFKGLDIEPHSSVDIPVPTSIENDGEYCLNIYVNDKRNMPWIDDKNLCGTYQVVLNEYKFKAEKSVTEPSQLSTSENPLYIDISGEDFTVRFNKADGTISSYIYKNTELINQKYQDGDERGLTHLPGGIKPNIWRALTDNDGFLRNGKNQWYDKVWHIIEYAQIVEQCSKYVIIKSEGYLAPPACTPLFTTVLTFKISYNGEVTVNAELIPFRKELPPLPRFGVLFEMPLGFNDVCWYGRGDKENYLDLKLSSILGYYEKKVSDMHEPYIRPQESGNRGECRYAAVTNKLGVGFLITGDDFNFSAHHYTVDVLYNKCRHQEDIPEMPLTQISVDGFVSGIGSNSCGPQPLEKYIVKADNPLRFTFTFRGFDKNILAAEEAWTK